MPYRIVVHLDKFTWWSFENNKYLVYKYLVYLESGVPLSEFLILFLYPSYETDKPHNSVTKQCHRYKDVTEIPTQLPDNDW